MPLRIAIVDDLPADIDQLEAELCHSDAVLTCSRYDSGTALLDHFSPGVLDLIFLDICMEGTDGLETARQIRHLDARCLIVFVTLSPEYMASSFEFHPFDYLLKPWRPERVQRLLVDAQRALSFAEASIEVQTGRQSVRIPLSRIQYITAQNHAVIITTDTGECRSNWNFSDVFDALHGDPRFLLCNRGICVNMDFVTTFEPSRIVMTDGAAFPVHQRNKSQLFRQYAQYQFQHMRTGQRSWNQSE